VKTFAYKNHDRLSIIDPNNPENDIAGGSSKFHVIQTTFRELHALLRERVLAATQTRSQGYCILKDLLGGNYSSFRRQRLHLEKLSKDSRDGKR
jgi:non-canonical poly(A) RNA polymerase PAPD5/7